MNAVRIAAANYPITRHPTWDAYVEHVEQWVNEAVQGGAQMLVFPEYGAMELCSLLDAPLQADLHGQIRAMQRYLEPFIALHQRLAQHYRVIVCAASFPVWQTERFFNRVHLCLPDGSVQHQDKLAMTRFEDEQWNINASNQLRVFDSPAGTLGIVICYDSEFPVYARQLVEMGADILLAPSCTDTIAGYNRVRIGCQARALENQCYVIHSPTVGDAPWSPAVDENHGAAAVYTPVDRGFPADGVLAQAQFDEPCWLYANLDLAKLEQVRLDGQVLNHRDWPRQFRKLECLSLPV